MQQLLPQILRTEQAIFNLICNVDELRALKHELSIQDIDQIEQELKKLRLAIQKKQQALAQWIFPCAV